MVARSLGPCYKLGDLVKACKQEGKTKKGKVRVRKDAKADAKDFFNLDTETKIIAFVAIGDFDQLTFDNTDKLNAEPDKGVTFDAYIFKIGPVKHVYFAFYQRSNGTWIIKSFHPPEYGGKTPFYLPFASLKEIK